MFVLFVLLISLSSVAFANEIPEDPNFSVSGYAFNTTFQDTHFHENRSVVAVNLDADYKQFAFRTQITSADPTIRRAVIEYSVPLGTNTEFVYQYGRFGRIDSFFNGVLDSPASFQMAILPFAGYSYRMYNGSFTLMDGHHVVLRNHYGDNLITFRGAYGKTVINSQEDLQKEAFHRYDKDFNLVSRDNNYDLGLHWESKSWHVYTALNKYSVGNTTSSRHPVKQAIYKNFNQVEYTVNRTGIQYDNQCYFVRTEYTEGATRVRSIVGKETGKTDAHDHNIVIGKYIGNFVAYGGISRGFNETAKTNNKDDFVGVTYTKPRYSVSLEYHKGVGDGWTRYENTINDYRWGTFVVSTTVKF